MAKLVTFTGLGFWLVTVGWILFVLFVPFYIFALDDSFYNDKFQQYGVYESFKNATLVQEQFHHIKQYLLENELSLAGEFSSRELIHMEDVRDLFGYARNALFYGTILFFLGTSLLLSLKKPSVMIRAVLFASMGFLVFCGVITVSLFLDFETIFILFHKLLFRNDFWMLDANTLLIRLFPEQIFFDVGVRMLYLSGGICIVAILLSMLFDKTLQPAKFIKRITLFL